MESGLGLAPRWSAPSRALFSRSQINGLFRVLVPVTDQDGAMKCIGGGT